MYVPILSPPFMMVIEATLRIVLAFAIYCDSGSSSSSILFRKRTPSPFQTPSRSGNSPKNPIGSEGSPTAAAYPIKLTPVMTVKPMYWPTTISMGVSFYELFDSAKNICNKYERIVDIGENERETRFANGAAELHN